MKKVKSVGAIALIAVVCAAVFFFFQFLSSWPVRFRSQFNDFFGKGNWQCVSGSIEESTLYQSHRNNGNTLYHTWQIDFTSPSGEPESWNMGTLTLKTNHQKYSVFSSKRLSAKQALTLDFMYNSFDFVGKEIHRDVLCSVLPKAEADCFRASISFRNGNPPPKLYSALVKEPWFNITDISAAHYLESELYDFYIDISVSDYRFKQLTAQEQTHLKESLSAIETSLKDRYGDYTDYKITLPDGITAEYSGTSATPN